MNEKFLITGCMRFTSISSFAMQARQLAILVFDLFLYGINQHAAVGVLKSLMTRRNFFNEKKKKKEKNEMKCYLFSKIL